MSGKMPSHLRDQVAAASQALSRKDAATIQRLLEDGMHPDLKLSSATNTKRGVTLAVTFDDPRIFDLYVRHGANLNMQVVARNNPLFASADNGDLRGVVRCLAAGADADTHNVGGKHGGHILHLAVEQGDAVMARHLLDGGAWKAIERSPDGRQSPLRMAETKGRNNPKCHEVLELMQDYLAFPRLDFEGGFRKADLFAANASGQCPLDHPETWERWGEVCDTLRAKGEQVDKADLLGADAKGRPWLERATECFALGKVVERLNRQGEGVSQDDLLDGGARPAPLLEAVRANRQITAVVNEANCAHWTVPGLRAVAGRFDAYEREMFTPNFHQLTHWVAQQEHLRGAEGRGR